MSRLSSPAFIVRLVLATLAGGVVWFVWGAAAHMVFQLGDASFKRLPNESAVMQTLRSTEMDDGLYIFPHWDETKTDDEAMMAELEAKYREGPVGIMVYRKSVNGVMPPSTLALEFLGGLVGSAIAALVIARLGISPCRAVVLGALLATASWCTHTFSEWVWYGFPTSWVRDALIEQVAGWALASATIAAIMPRCAAGGPDSQTSCCK